jgi:hypothetical protein
MPDLTKNKNGYHWNLQKVLAFLLNNSFIDAIKFDGTYMHETCGFMRTNTTTSKFPNCVQVLVQKEKNIKLNEFPQKPKFKLP